MDLKYMDIAYQEALKAFSNDEVPIGAVIVQNGKIIAKAYNKKEKHNCCISHAEILAIQKASLKLHNWRLENCDMYVTLEPCPMCASAIKQARIRNVYCGLANADSHNNTIIKEIFKQDAVNPSVNFVNNLCENAVKKLLKDFFSIRRAK